MALKRNGFAANHRRSFSGCPCQIFFGSLQKKRGNGRRAGMAEPLVKTHRKAILSGVIETLLLNFPTFTDSH